MSGALLDHTNGCEVAPIASLTCSCVICGHVAKPAEAAQIRCNVRRFRDRRFPVWRCAQCRSIHCAKVPDLDDYYRDYPIRAQRLDYFSRTWYHILLRRLVAAGLKKTDRILDHGCNQGLLVQFLREQGYDRAVGYDPFVPSFASPALLARPFDFVLSIDVIEHDDDPRNFVSRLVGLLRPDGKLCINTPCADGISLFEAERSIHQLHVPYHLHVLSQQALRDLAAEAGLSPLAAFDRWYMDGRRPGTSRNFIETYLRLGGNDIDVGYEPPRPGLILRHPTLVFRFLFGSLLRSKRNDNAMLVFARQKPEAQSFSVVVS